MTDFTKSQQEVVVDLINQANPDAFLKVGELTFGVPAPSPTHPSKNTGILGTGAADSRIVGSKTFYYDRLHLQNDVLSTSNIRFTKGPQLSNLAQVIAAINARYKINLTASDYVASAFPSFSNDNYDEVHPINLTIKPESWIYQGSGMVEIAVNPDDVVVPEPVEDPVVSLDDPSGANEGESVYLTVRLDKASDQDLTVNLDYAGSATRDVDYTASSTVVIQAGQTSAQVEINLLVDGEVEGEETVVVTAQSGSGYTVHPSQGSVSFNIFDIDNEPTEPGADDPIEKYDQAYPKMYRGASSQPYPTRLHGVEYPTIELFTAPWCSPPADGSDVRINFSDYDDGLGNGRYQVTTQLAAPQNIKRDWEWFFGARIPYVAGRDVAAQIADFAIYPSFDLFQSASHEESSSANLAITVWPKSIDLNAGTSVWGTYADSTGARDELVGEAKLTDDGEVYVTVSMPMAKVKSLIFWDDKPNNGTTPEGIVVGLWHVRGKAQVNDVNPRPNHLPDWNTWALNANAAGDADNGGGGTDPGEEGPVVPMARGFFVSNKSARAVTNDFEVYQDIPDANAPVFGDSYYTEAAAADGSGKVWAFLTNGDWTWLHRSQDGGRTWTKDSFIPESGFGGLDWKFMGRHLAYFRGSVYGYFRERSTNLIWVCRLREEAETGGAFDLQKVLPINQTNYPTIAGDTNSALVLASEELDEDAISYELRSYLHWSENLDEWTKYQLTHPWSTNPELVPRPAVNVLTVSVHENRIFGVGELTWYKPEDHGRRYNTVFFEVDMSEGLNAEAKYTFFDPWPLDEGQTELPGNIHSTSIETHVRTMVVDETILLYVGNVSRLIDYVEEVRSGVLMTKPLFSMEPTEFTTVEANTGIIIGMLYDNTQRTVISGRRNTTNGAGTHFMAFTSDRTLQTWQFDDSSENPFGKVDTTNSLTYVSAVRDGEPEEPYFPEISDPIDVRWPIPAEVNVMSQYSNMRAAEFQSTGKLVLGGSFLQVENQSKYKYLARMNLNKDKGGAAVVAGDALDLTFNPPYNSQSSVNELYQVIVGPNDELLVSLSASRVGGVDVKNFVKQAADGGSPKAWPAVEMRDEYNSLTINNARLYKTAGNKILLAAGQLRKVNGVDSYYLARFNWDGTVDTSFVSPFNPDQPLAAYNFNGVSVLPDGRMLVTNYRQSPSDYRVSLISAEGVVADEADQPFSSVDNQQVTAVVADPYSDGFFLYSQFLALKSEGNRILDSITRMNPDFTVDASWKGHVGQWMDTYYAPDIIALSDGTGYLIAKPAVYWYDQDGRKLAQRGVFAVDLNGKYMPGRVPLDFGQSTVQLVRADPANTGNPQNDVYYALGGFDVIKVGNYPRIKNVKQYGWCRFRVLPDQNAVPQA